jgi:hypothetical protein
MISRRIAALAVVVGLAATAGWVIVTHAQRTASQASKGTPLDAHRTLGSAQTYRNLTLFPVYDSTTKAADTYATLDEGLKARQVQVKESKNGGDVNTLYVTNSAKKPLYLMAGEVVLGGQQDRCLAKDTIVPAGKKGIPVTVFCVEHGRWSGRSEFDQSAPTIAGLDIRAKAQNGEFKATQDYARANAGPAPAGAGRVGGRRTLPPAQTAAGSPARISGSESVGKAQQEVWDGVAEKNRKLKIENQTGTYRDALTMKAGDTQKDVPAYVKSLSGSLGSDPHLVGVVAAVDGKVIAADIFGDPVLFRKLWPKLLRSYAADAVESTPEKGKKMPVVSAPDVKAFLLTAADEKSKAENRSDVSTTLRLESKDATVYRLVPNGKASFGGGRAAKPVHESVLRK